MSVDVYAENGIESVHIITGRIGINDGTFSELQNLTEEINEEITEIKMRIFYNRREMEYETFREELDSLVQKHQELYSVRLCQKLREDGWNIRVDI